MEPQLLPGIFGAFAIKCTGDKDADLQMHWKNSLVTEIETHEGQTEQDPMGE